MPKQYRIGSLIVENDTVVNCDKKHVGDIIIPNDVKHIGPYAFEYCTSLQSVIIPNSVTSIGGGVFYKCTSLTNVRIGDSVTSIDDYAFIGCELLESITIPDGVTIIGSHAFYGCTLLKNVTINSDNINNIEELGISKSAIIKCNPDSITDKAAKAAGYITQPIMTPLQKALLDAQDVIKNNTNNNLSIER